MLIVNDFVLAMRTVLKMNTSIRNLVLADCKNLDDTIFPVIAESVSDSLVSEFRRYHL